MMTELDSLGDSIHKLFTQMITIISFFSAVILKKQKLALNELMDVNLGQLKEKEQLLKKMEQQQNAKNNLEKERQHDRLKQIQKLKFNFRELFKMQINTEKESKIIESLWKTIVTENKNSVKECMKIQDSQLKRIIKDSCEYMYKNHTELKDIVKLKQQDLLVTEKALNGFGDKSQLIEENEQKITKMKEVAGEIVEYVRERVYDKKHTQTQTMLSMIDNDRPFITTKELDEKRKMELKIKNFEKSLKQKNVHIEKMDKKLKQTQEKLRHFQEKYDYDDQSESQQASSKQINNNGPANKLMRNMGRKSKHQNFNSFKISPSSKTSAMGVKNREASFTAGKKFSKLSKQSSEFSLFGQKNSKRSSSISKQFTLAYRNSNCNSKAVKNIMDNLNGSSAGNQESVGNKLSKVPENHSVIEANSYEQIGRKMQRSHQSDKQDDSKDKCRGDRVSIDQIKSCKESNTMINSIGQQQIELQNCAKENQSRQKDKISFAIVHSFKIIIRPTLKKRYIQSVHKPQSEVKKPELLLENEALKSTKLKKSISQKEISRYFFQPLNSLERFGPITHYRQASCFHEDKIKNLSAVSCQKNSSFDNILHQNASKSNRNVQYTAEQLKGIGIMQLKNQKHSKSSLKQNSSILKGTYNKKQPQSILKKTSTTKQNVSFGFLPGSQKRRRQSMYVEGRQQKQSNYGRKMNRLNSGGREDLISKIKNNQMVSMSPVIQEEGEGIE